MYLRRIVSWSIVLSEGTEANMMSLKLDISGMVQRVSLWKFARLDKRSSFADDDAVVRREIRSKKSDITSVSLVVFFMPTVTLGAVEGSQYYRLDL